MAMDDLIASGFANKALIEKMYVAYQTDPSKVDPKWREAFDQFERSSQSHLTEEPIESVAQIDRFSPNYLRVYNLIQAYRTYGHLMAKINSIATHPIDEPWQLKLETLGFSEQELSLQFPTNGLFNQPSATLKEIIACLKEIYCNNIGVEYMGVQDPQFESWLQRKIEPNRFKIKLSIEHKKMILQYLNKTELFEVFLHTKYVGQKRFSLEGGETLIPILAAVIEIGAGLGLKEFVLGMAHRGRLNVLSNIMQKSYSQIFSEFEEGYISLSFEGSGDVKYHKGFSSTIQTENGHFVNVVLAPNPSHLEAVDSVVQGQTYAKQVQKGDDQLKEHVVPVLIHGDASLSGQGIVYETMQLCKLNGYSTGGTVHLIVNNQVGFTTQPQDGRSTRYCSDIARTFNAPVFHVNVEDPESCIYATNLAVQMRQKFHCDVFVDINCYRKYGHNEADEPSFTQPLEYQIIRKKQPIREKYRDALIQQGVLERQMAEALEEVFKQALQKALKGMRYPEKNEKKERITNKQEKKEKKPIKSASTAVPKKVLKELTQNIFQVPEKLSIHRKLEKIIQERLLMGLGKKPIDWGMGETLAYATLLLEGAPIRISGQDC